MNLRPVVVAMTIALVSVACGGAGPEFGGEPPVEAMPEPDRAVPVLPDGAEPGQPPEEAQLVEPTPGMEGVHPVEWDAASMDGTTVEVSWWSGVAPCTVLDRVEVEETEDVVTITLFEGSEPSDEEVGCIMIAQRKRTIVELSEPVGTRDLVDGAES